jgi:hypothetical protein
MRPRQLWSVTQAGVVANERAAGITGANPFKIDEFYVSALFHIRVTAKAGSTLGGVRIYGAVDVASGFPTPGLAAEVLCSTATNINLNEGLLRVPALHAVDADTKFPCQIVPRFLLLEYDTTVGGGITFIVDATFIGPVIGGRA